jgi:small GTP-binding protein
MKIVLLGEGRVGKTSLVTRWVQNTFDTDQPSTVDAQMYLKKRVFIDGKSVEVAVWDTAGQERFHALGPLYYRNADGAVLVYDCTDEDTFDRVRRWVKELRKAASPHLQLVLCGNKADRERERQVEVERAEAYARKQDAVHMPTSAKSNLNVDEAFMTLIRNVVHAKARAAAGAADFDDDDLFGATGGAAASSGKRGGGGGRLKIVDDDEPAPAPSGRGGRLAIVDDEDDSAARTGAYGSSGVALSGNTRVVEREGDAAQSEAAAADRRRQAEEDERRFARPSQRPDPPAGGGAGEYVDPAFGKTGAGASTTTGKKILLNEPVKPKPKKDGNGCPC